MSKGIKKAVSFALPAASMLIPGMQPLGAAALGAAGGLLSGGGLKGALLGGIGNYVGGGGFGSALGSTASKALGGAISGLGSGGGLKGALLGSLGGAGADLLMGGSGSNILTGGNGADVLNSAPAKAASVASAGLSGSGIGGLSSFAKPLMGLIGAYNDMESADEMEKIIRKQQELNQLATSPYAQAGSEANQQLQSRLSQGFTAPDLATDPGYQFNLSESQKGMDRANQARGSYFSGAALKEASDRAQGLANTTYNEAYQRWLAQNQQLAGQAGQGLNATGAITGYGDNAALAAANASTYKANSLNQALSRFYEDDNSKLLRALGVLQ